MTLTEEAIAVAIPEIKTLQELHAALKHEITESGDKNKNRIEELEKKYTDLEKDVRRELRHLADTHKRSVLGVGYEPVGHPEKDWNWGRFLLGVTSQFKNWDKKYPEYELCMETARSKTTSMSSVDSTGGFLVPLELMMDQIIPELVARSVVLNAGATLLDNLIGSPVEFPKITGVPDAVWTEESQPITETGVTFANVKLEAHGLSAFIPITNRLILQSSGRVQAIIRRLLTESLRRKLDLAIFKGTGALQPLGILNQSGIGQVSATSMISAGGGNNQEMTGFLDEIIGKLEDADALQLARTESLYWFMHPHTRRWFHKFNDGAGRPLFFEAEDKARPTSGSGATFFGHNFATTTQLTGNNNSSDLVFVDVEQILVGQWGTLLVESTREGGNAWRNNLTEVKATMEVDVGLGHGESVAEATSLDTTSVPVA